MIPILLPATTTTFPSGISPLPADSYRLSDCIDCKVTETINEEYSLSMKYHVSGRRSEELEEGRYIYCRHDATSDLQPFEIKRVKKSMDGMIEILAEHISYKLQRITIYPFTAASLTAAVAAIPGASITTNPFTFAADFTSNVPYTLRKPMSSRNILNGEEGSILDVYGRGEWVFDKWTATIVQARGADHGARIRRGHNLTELNVTRSATSAYNAIVPFYYDSIGGMLVTAGDTFEDKVVSDGDPYTDALPVDVTYMFDSVPTSAQVATAGASWLASNKPQKNGEPEMKVKFSSDVADLAGASVADAVLGDAVTVTDDTLGINEKNRIVKVVWDVLRDRYNSIEVGKVSPTLYKILKKNGGN